MKRASLTVLRVFALPSNRSRGILVAGPLRLPCALGRAGIGWDKRESDGRTPRGQFRLGRLHYRADRGPRPATLLPVRATRPRDGWCDDPRDWRYNRHVLLPCGASAETMWRDDHLYDIVVEISWNVCPRVRGRGSAIFLHLARDDFAPTAGCVAIRPKDARRLLARLGPRTILAVR
ncbi:L,D-transpeptidase [Chelatococcus sp. GCM10030263]|uniref:L,D-transpeptidase family protein n=1 Tax=Chelatococcus sp. GCM10030263 TaxID=3273387 RepID=UPI00361D0B78